MLLTVRLSRLHGECIALYEYWKTFHPASNKTITRPVIQRTYWNGDYYYTATYENLQ